jgi:parvulin-like peptidyl-prolyl isomerase
MRTPRWIVVVAVLAMAVWSTQAEPVTANGIKAIVHDSVITYEEVEVASAQAAEFLQRQYRTSPSTFRAKLSEVRTNSLEQLLQRQLILRDFAQAGYNLPESFVDEAVAERIRERFGNDPVKFAKTLQADGVTREKFRQQLRDQIIVEILRSKNVFQEAVMSPHKIEKYYLEHRDKYQVEDEVKLRMIVLNKSTSAEAERVRTLAGEILAKLKEGASFAEMASVYSQGSQRSQGGDWGWVEKSVLKQELAEVAFKLKAGERSEIIELPEACYLMLVEESRPAHTKPLGDLREDIERTLLLEERARLQQRYIEKLRTKTFVRYF